MLKMPVRNRCPDVTWPAPWPSLGWLSPVGRATAFAAHCCPPRCLHRVVVRFGFNAEGDARLKMSFTANAVASGGARCAIIVAVLGAGPAAGNQLADWLSRLAPFHRPIAVPARLERRQLLPQMDFHLVRMPSSAGLLAAGRSIRSP